MLEQQNPYNHPQMQQEQGMIPPQGQMMSPPMQPRPNWAGQDGRRQRKEVSTIGKRLFPNWLSLYPMVAYVAGNVDAGDKCGDKSRKSGDKSYD